MNEVPYESKPIPPSGHGTTLQTIRRAVRNGDRFACLTCYDATTARWLQRAGIPLLLVGDTAAEMILGEPGTIADDAGEAGAECALSSLDLGTKILTSSFCHTSILIMRADC